MSFESPAPAVRARPALFRALGKCEPPELIRVGGRVFDRVEVLKHDSWAATAIYQAETSKIVCKFNRQQSILGFPMRWLGRALARREAKALQLLGDLPNVPRLCPAVVVDGLVLQSAVAHNYVLGHPLGVHERVATRFFENLQGVLAEMHRRGMAYVDLHKRENILVGDDGLPYLIDFQISFILPRLWLARILPCRTVFRLMCLADLYHLRKHMNQNGIDPHATPPISRPWWIRLHRLFAQPLRTCRRKLLVLCGVRSGRGKAHTEQFAEDAVRRELAAKEKPAA